MSLLFALALLFQPQPELTQLERFLSGRTQGSGSVQIMMSGTSTIQTEGRGSVLPDGSFRLEHVLRQQGEPERRRTWNMRRSSPTRYTGTISDARGPVTASVTGNQVRVEYRTTEGYWIDQMLTINADGRSAANRTRISRFGIGVATLQETIRKVD